MDKVICYKASNGKLFDTEREAEREDLKEEYIKRFVDLPLRAGGRDLIKKILEQGYIIVKENE